MGIFGRKPQPVAEPYVPNPDPIFGEINPQLTAPMPKKQSLLGGLGKVLGTAAEVAAYGPFLGVARENRQFARDKRAAALEEVAAERQLKIAQAQKALRPEDNRTGLQKDAEAAGYQPGTPEFAGFIKQATMARALPDWAMAGPDGGIQPVPGAITPEQKDQRDFAQQLALAQMTAERMAAGQERSDARFLATFGAQERQRQNERLASTRKEFDDRDEVKAYRTSVPVLASALKAPKTAAGDLDLIYAMGKIMDPNSVVREGELALAGGSGSWAERLQGLVARGGGTGPGLPLAMRKRLTDALANRVAQQAQAYNAARNQYGNYARSLGLPDAEVLGMHPGDQLVTQGLARRSGSGLTRPTPKAPPKPKPGSGGANAVPDDVAAILATYRKK